MRFATGFLIVLPALVAGHPLDQRADMSIVAGSATYGVDGKLIPAPSATAGSGTAACETNSWNSPGMATIRLSDVHLQWGSSDNPTVKNVYGSANWFNFPFWCPETEFTIFAFPNGTTSSDMGDLSTSTGQTTCKLTGASTHGDIPLVKLDISNQAPFVQATDLTGTMDMAINAECGIMRPRLGIEFPSSETPALSAAPTGSAIVIDGPGAFPVSETGLSGSASDYANGYTRPGTSLSTSGASGHTSPSSTHASSTTSGTGTSYGAGNAYPTAPAESDVPTSVVVENGVTFTLTGSDALVGKSTAPPSVSKPTKSGATGSAHSGSSATASGSSATGSGTQWQVKEAPTGSVY